MPSEDAQALERGEITREEYMERRLEHQIRTLGLQGMLSGEKLEVLRQIMREEFFDSPVLEGHLDRLIPKVSAKR